MKQETLDIGISEQPDEGVSNFQIETEWSQEDTKYELDINCNNNDSTSSILTGTRNTWSKSSKKLKIITTTVRIANTWRVFKK